MIPKQEDWTIVLAGQWNVRIFSPEWVAKEIFDVSVDKIQVEVSLALGDNRIRFSKDDISLIPQNDRIIIGIKTCDDKVLQNAENLAKKIFTLLPQTPIKGFGINFGFVEEKQSREIISLFQLDDGKKISDHKCKLQQTEITRKLQVKNSILNLKHVFEDDNLFLRLNFHHEINSAKTARTKLRNKTIWCKNFACQFLNKVYGLVLEEEKKR